MLLDGKKISGEIQAEIHKKLSLSKKKPGLAVLLVGDNPASKTYVKAKSKACDHVGIFSKTIELPASIAESDLLKQIDQLNRNPEVHGILVQLPLPLHIDEKKVMAAIDPNKDVDGFHPVNVGKMLLGEEGGFLPCTPLGIKVLLERSRIETSGKHVVILGRSNIVGKPLAAILMQKKSGCNATVTVAHSQSEYLSDITRSADILVAAIGKPHFVTKDLVKRHATVIDVGINRMPDGKLVGDVDFKHVSETADHITPVPGGIGPMTIAMLLQNTLSAFLKMALFLIILASCQKQELSSQFKGEEMEMPYQVVVGKPLSKKEHKAIANAIQTTFAEAHETFREISNINEAKENALIPLSPILQELLSLHGEHTIRNGILKKTVSLDVQGVARGKCVDLLIERLQKLSLEDVFVQWGTHLRAIGHHPDKCDWLVPINPALTVGNQPIAPIPLRDCAMATSQHSGPIASVCVIAPTCALADSLAEAAILFPNRKQAESWAQEVVEKYPEVRFWILSYRK